MNTDVPLAITSDEITTYQCDGVALLPEMFDEDWIKLLKQGLYANCENPTDRSRVWDRYFTIGTLTLLLENDNEDA